MASYNSYTSSYNSINNSTYEYQFLQEQQNTERRPPQKPFRSSSFPIRNNKKHHIAPLPPTPPKVYKVDPVDFRDVVQKLTGKNHSHHELTRLQEVAPPPLSLTRLSSLPSGSSGFMAGVEEDKQWKSFDSAFGGLSPLGISLSPSSMAWCSSILMSPGTIMSTNLERSA